MKKYILLIVLSLVSISLSAKAPDLNVEKMFDDTYKSNPSVSLIISRTPDKYFRGCTVTNNAALVKKVEQLFDKDLPRAARSQDLSSNGSQFRSMTVINNGEEINIGLGYEPDDGCYLFISGPLNAFK